MKRPFARKLLAVSLATATLGSLAACSSEAAPTAEGVTSVTVWNRATGDASVKLSEMIETFNGLQDDYNVETQTFPADGFNVKVLQAINADQAPNVVLSDGNPSQLGETVKTGKLIALDDLFGTGDYPLAASDIPQGMLKTGVFDGKTYGLPTEGGTYAVIYNKAQFEEAGITETPTTWAELADAAEKLTTDSRHGMYLPIGSDEWPVYTWQSMLWSAGGEFLSEDNTSVEFDSPEGVEALTTWTDMVESGVAYPSSVADSNQKDGWPAFNAGLVSMFIGQLTALSNAQEGLGDENVGVFTFPEISEPAANTGTNLSYIIDGTETEDAGSYAFLSWFLQPEQQAVWDITSNYLPTNVSTQSTETYAAYLEENPEVQVFIDQFAYANSRPSILNYTEISAALGAELEKAMLLQQSPEEALSNAAKAAQEALDN